MKKILAFVFVFLSVVACYAQPTVPPMATMKSASYYLYMPTAQNPSAVPLSADEMLANEEIDLPGVSKWGLNTVLLVEFRTKFDPGVNNVYDPAGLENFRMELETARQAGLRVMIGLNYGDGLHVERPGTTEAIYVQRFQMESWVRFVTWLLTNIDDYRDMVYPVAFEEGHIGATWSDLFGQINEIADAERVSIGNLPALLDPALRARWSLGWYGAVTGLYANLGHPSAQGYDYYMQGAYYFDRSISLSWLPETSKGWTDEQIRADWTRLFDHLQSLYPGQTIAMFEGGYYTCSTATLDRAAQVYALLARLNLERGMGFNLWGYRSMLTPEQECEIRHGKGGHSMGNPDGSPRPALPAVAAVIQEFAEPMQPTRMGIFPVERPQDTRTISGRP